MTTEPPHLTSCPRCGLMHHRSYVDAGQCAMEMASEELRSGPRPALTDDRLAEMRRRLECGFSLGREETLEVVAEAQGLRTEARKWYGPSGAFGFCATSEEVTDLRREAATRLGAVERAVRDYHYAMDTHEPTSTAMIRAVAAVEAALGMRWKPGAEKERREGGGS